MNPNLPRYYLVALRTDRRFQTTKGTTPIRALVGVLSLWFAVAVPQAASGQSPTADSFNPGADGIVLSMAARSDGKVFIAGDFTTLGMQPHSRIGLLNPDGTPDAGFNPGASYYVASLVAQADGKILLGGWFDKLGGQTRNRIGRLNSNGTLDGGFNPGANNLVSSLAVQVDGKIVVGGWFASIAGQMRNGIARLSTDGTAEPGFNPGVNGTVNSLALQADGKILVAGNFASLGGQARNQIGRLNADGTLDMAFNPGANSMVVSLLVEGDGRILVAGTFTTLGGQPRNYIARLNPNGTVDAGFNPGANGSVLSLAEQTDGKILAGGNFTELGGQPRNYIGRLNPDGTVDTAFNPGADHFVRSLAVQADGRILVGGEFSLLAGQPRSRIGRLNNTDVATQSLNFSGSTITWLRGGASPLVWRTTFEATTNGMDWFGLGAGTPVPGGWQLSGISPPPGNTIRGRGYVSGGQYNTSGWFVETLAHRPWFLNNPASRTNNAGTTATFQGLAGGTEPLTYQWLKDGITLTDGGNIAGAATPMLAVTNVVGTDAGNYSLAVSNAEGIVTSAVASLTVIDPLITGQPIGQYREGGQSVSFSVAALGAMPLNYQWVKDGAIVPHGTSATLTLTNLQTVDAGLYSVIVSNAYGSLTSSGAFLTVNLAVVDTEFAEGANYDVTSLATQHDGKILVGGRFATLAGQPRDCIGRLYADGSLDPSFNPNPSYSLLLPGPDLDETSHAAAQQIVKGGAPASVLTLAVQTDGKILAGGSFTKLAGQPRSRIGRFNADGSLDSGFDPGADSDVNALAVQTDGRILVGGAFTTLGGQPRNYIGRLNADGTLDLGFDPGAGGVVNSLALQPDGRILAGGQFSKLGGQWRSFIGRLEADGSLDSSFDPGAAGLVNCLAVQADGRILAGGQFTKLGGQPRNFIGRLEADGSLDSSFNPGAQENYGSVVSLALQADGKILVGGTFTTLGGALRNNLGRLNPDGTPDLDFTPIASSSVLSLAVQTDGKILAGGHFTSLCGQPRNYLGRLNNTEPATQDLACDGPTVTWLRGGSSPEVWRTTFEVSTNGTNWSSLGTGVRVPGGWHLADLNLPDGARIRARGFVTGGYENGTSWFVETMLGAPTLVSQPVSQTNEAGTTVKFVVDGLGTEPLVWQWRKDGVGLSNNERVSGANTPFLRVGGVIGDDAGHYSVVLSNAEGSVTSLVATLTVHDPTITSQPVSQNREPGQSASLTVTAAGASPLAYQWWKEGVPLPQDTASTLSFTNLQGADAGRYFVVVSNGYGSVTSTAALLSINLAELDAGFDPGANDYVYSLAVQPDGKILAGGYLSSLGGQARGGFGRLNADGSLDLSFNPGAGGYVYALAVQVDGEILVGGSFTTLGGQPRNCIGRLNADGTLDTSFNPGASSVLRSLELQADGKILAGGYFTTLGGQPRNCIGRLNADGTLDASFNPGASAAVRSLALQADGKILAGGNFTTLGGQPRNYIGRLNADGSLDTSFNPGAGGYVYSLALQADGKILAGGNFIALGGQPCNYIGRLNADGTLDASFNPGASSPVLSLALQADGKILMGGYFTTVGGQPRKGIARLNANGTVDAGFNPEANFDVNSLAVQADGKIVAGGNFTTLGGRTRSRIGRLNNTESATQSLAYNGSAITWLRGGSSTEVSRTTFEVSTNATIWSALGQGDAIPGGWQLSDVFLPLSCTIRARGHLTGNGSSWFVESLAQVTSPPRPLILANDGLLGLSNGWFGFNVRGLNGQALVIEASTNLTNWIRLQTNTLGLDPFYFSDPGCTNFSWRFYRARLQP